ncbi:hypothetical protein TWF481_010309 [Arthrobotrys musiformis]|uniref:Uncharacterized protein n=1 Tax=Arthrobotrys musiformis TaxID=47236 RepID=A0AAV9W0D1_9PEZI
MPSIVKVFNNTTCTVTFYDAHGVEKFKIHPEVGDFGSDYAVPGNEVRLDAETWELPAKGKGYLGLQIEDWDPMQLSNENGHFNVVAMVGGDGGGAQPVEYRPLQLPEEVDLLVLQVDEYKHEGIKQHCFKVYEWPSGLKGDPRLYRRSMDLSQIPEVFHRFGMSTLENFPWKG